jgi:multiple sugar transport system substrate-binding protein
MWKNNGRRIQVAMLMLLVVALLLGVGGPAHAAAKTTVTFWTFLNPEAADPRSKALKAAIEGFMAENPDIEVKAESIHWGKIDGLAIQAAAAGGGPDILNIYSVQLTKHVNAKVVAPLNTYVEKWYPKNKDDYIIPLKETEYDGKVMALLWETRVWVLWYRQDLLEKAGLKVPQTLDELAKAAQKIASDRVQGFVVGLSDTQLAAAFVETFEPLLWARGGSLLDAKGKAAFNSPAGQQTLQWIADLVRTGGMGKEAVGMNADDILSGFKAGTTAMSFQGSMRVSAAREGKDVGPMIRTAPVPGLQAGKPTPGLTAGQTLTIGANSKNKDAAWRFIEYYLSPKVQLGFAKASVVPIRKSVYVDPYFQTPQGQELIQWRDYIEKYGRVGRYPEDFAKLSELLARAAQDVVLRNVPVKQALDDAAAKYNAQAGM